MEMRLTVIRRLPGVWRAVIPGMAAQGLIACSTVCGGQLEAPEAGLVARQGPSAETVDRAGPDAAVAAAAAALLGVTADAAAMAWSSSSRGNMKTIYELYRDNLIAEGGSPKTDDSTRVLLSKWVTAAGGNPRPGDTRNVLFQKLARAKGKTPFPGDTTVGILRRIADGGPADNEWTCLHKLL